MDHVHAIIDSDSQDERQYNHIGRIEWNCHQAHRTEHHQCPCSHRDQCQQHVANVSKIEHQDSGHSDQRVYGRLDVALLHLTRRVIRLQRFAGDIGIDPLDVGDELFESIHIPDVATAVDLEQMSIAFSHESRDQAVWQIVQAGWFRIRRRLESVQATQQIACHALLKLGQSRVALVQRHSPYRIANLGNLPAHGAMSRFAAND